MYHQHKMKEQDKFTADATEAHAIAPRTVVTGNM